MTQSSSSAADWILAAREHVMGDGTRVCLAEPGDAGVEALFSMGWADWTKALGDIGIGIGSFVFPVPRGAARQVVGAFSATADLHAAIAGDARRPVVLQRSGDGARGCAVLWVPPSLTCFRGHFPLQPVVPGVVLMGWAVGEMRRPRPGEPDILEFRQVKFQRVVTPCDTLRISWAPAGASLANYLVESSAGINAKGQCVFEEEG
jgi:3-hydroxymyristoyl/3-hydroxydecanoyl-(acyl carrier protein) dehydratase